MFIIFLIILTNIILAKRLKYIGLKYSSLPNYSDLQYSVIVTILIYVSVYFSLSPLILFVLIILNILFFIDISLFKVYSINLDFSSIKMFLQNSKIFLNQDKDDVLIDYIKYRKFYLFPLFTSISYLIVIYDFKYEQHFLLAYLFYIFIVVVKVKLKKFTTAIVLFVFVLSSIYFDYKLNILYEIDAMYILYILIFISSIYLIQNRLQIQNDFFNQQCKISDFINMNKLSYSKPKELHHLHDKIVNLNYSNNTTSQYVYKDANVILITIESLNKEIFDSIKDDFNLYDNSSVSSKCHFCLSSNTYESLFTLYNETYKEKNNFNSLKRLNEQGYKNIFFTPQDLSFEQTDILLKESGFNILLSDNSGDWGGSDGLFYDKKYNILKKELKDEKYYLHILNSQTHIPYKVRKSNIHKYMNGKKKYIESLKESLREIDILLDKMKADGLLNNTIIIFTGDHGESFGELDYTAHSTSITKEQINVPFFLSHKGFNEAIDISFSTHFDILPTVLDLLGIKSINENMGQTIFLNKEYEIILYSKTKINGMPASFGFVNNQEKFLIDLVYNRFWVCDLNDNLIRNLIKDEKEKILCLMYEALKRRNLI